MLVEGRACGACNVCCVALTIDDPALQKPQGVRCRNARRDSSCAIYDNRPQTCREFYCGWRALPWVREGLRPDRSDVLIRLHMDVAADGTQTLGIVVTLLSAKALDAEGLAETVAAAVSADAPVYLNVPGPPGYTASRARLNEVLRGSVLARDKAGVIEALRRARAEGRKGERQRIVLKPRPPRPG